MAFIYAYQFILGAVLGSFYNVVGLRVPENVSIVRPRSHCPACKRTLGTLDLVPILSYLFLHGKCRGCGTKISVVYPAVELVTGLLFIFALYRFGLTGELAIALLFISLLVIIFVSDISHMIIPDKVLLFFLPFLILGRIVVPLEPWWDMFSGAFSGFALLFLIAIISKGGMGFGDVKLFFVIGLVLGFKLTLLAFFIATLIGAFYGIAGIAAGRFKKRQPIPFGPFIAVGALVSYFYGGIILNWYFRMFDF
ncbi:prepilin peptidase [Peribacillus cavernae]|uniref:Prepilin peptidase n=1 Tax=Peribacillus cavernae TaxID=1674310 RepID=A0A433HHU4_9BACI|nr:A24 family peptidase [Peribacillus cavernae]MDQ0219381.1 leader peptidase (prepilin peptidase)/N-methyltransferase [Peribacillus cavernae]RUQ27743.1 prepilin peptidase [Peribacillus cavernae]